MIGDVVGEADMVEKSVENVINCDVVNTLVAVKFGKAV